MTRLSNSLNIFPMPIYTCRRIFMSVVVGISHPILIKTSSILLHIKFKKSSPTQDAGFSLSWLLLRSDPCHSKNRQSKKIHAVQQKHLIIKKVKAHHRFKNFHAGITKSSSMDIPEDTCPLVAGYVTTALSDIV